jgi:hypothetical protein
VIGGGGGGGVANALITGPAWDEVLLNVNRTVKVCVYVCV